MKRQVSSLLFSAILAAGFAIAAPQEPSAAPAPPAQDHAQRGPMDPNRQLQRMTKQLNLTSDQQNQILPILTGTQDQMKSIRGDSSLSDTDRRAKMRSLHEDTQAKIKAVLTDDQKKRFDEMQQRMRDRARDNRHDTAAPNAAPPATN